ncbi:AVAST type 1 anti-phage system protease Avs1b [Chromobacterium violaceum]|uniref:AVAST type 1 anti-phage system protease Avs1b n=1 Tax=Chromobacterium violaceum TaxID=536 RepID=UPI0005BCF49B|nr:AVAST type 1 anti-phage system protease Avs1b [Chromobacterium violaceum]
MTEEEVKLATCQVLSAKDSGTGWLVSPEYILTAYHCLGKEAAEGTSVNVSFGIGESASRQSATLAAFDVDLDVCLLKLQERSLNEPVPLNVGPPRPGERWLAFGYPVVKLQLGQVLQGTVQQTLKELVNGVDLDLSVSPESILTDYRGMSGSALITASGCQGMLRVSIDNAIGAVSMMQLRQFLTTNGVFTEAPTSEEHASPFASRPAFDELFESSIGKTGGGYLFLDGAHGIGKSTYCRGFSPESKQVEVLGVYAFSERSRGSTPALQAQPEVFVDWLTSLLSARATGKPARLMQLTYVQLIQTAHQALQELAQRCSNDGKVGLLFIDGINEAAAVGGDTLQRFIGLLPPNIPQGLEVVVVGAGLDAIADKLGGILQEAGRMTLPALDEDSQYRLCASSLEADKVTPTLVSALCDRAKGHPLYLRYLVDLVNSGASEDELEMLPPFSGSIEDYYETIWAQLLTDSNAINLLGIIARLRWGIPTANLTSMLTPSESAAFVTTLTRIRHLLSAPDTTEVYHSSFSDFVIHKTSTLSERIQGRLVDFCLQPSSGDYGTLNRVFHALLADPQKQLVAINECQQQWIDQSVLLGAEPDILLGDVEEVLEAATRLGTATDIVRLLLLSQRLKFRYDTLFAQAAGLVAEALIALGKTEQALRHILRYGHLIVDPSEAFAIVRKLIEAECREEALGVLQKIDQMLHSVLTRDGVKIGDFLSAAAIKLQGYGLASHAGADTSAADFLQYVVHLVTDPRNNFSPDDGQKILSDLAGNLLGNILCVAHSYRPLAQLPIPPGTPNNAQVRSLISVLAHAQMNARDYRVRLPRDKVDILLADIASKLDDSVEFDEKSFAVVNLLIEVGATVSLVEAYSNGVTWEAETPPLFTKNRALPDTQAFEEAYERLRVSYFLQSLQTKPTPRAPEPYDWEESLATLAQAVAWIDGTARRARASGDQAALIAAMEYLKNELLPCFDLALSSRVDWQEAYFIPENILPLLYGHLVNLYLDCMPEEVSDLLEVIEQSFDGQLGLYNEGFRRALKVVVGTLIDAGVSGNVADAVFSLLLRWRDYVRENVENRYELVPELLYMVPLFSRMEASDEALATYQSVLSVSMGPSWYKEDQFAVMSSVLTALPADVSVAPESLSQIAAYLERASGEMTFQRYVRADKGTFIGELCRRGLYADAVRYFQHQACGTIEEMRKQASDGNLDRVAPLVGMRYPGGALEEQASLLGLLEHAGVQADWRLRWSLLEVYQHGDDRYLRDWGPAYAGLIQEISHNETDLAWAIQRVGRIAQGMNSERAWLLFHGLVKALPESLRNDLSVMLDRLRASFTRSQFEKLTSRFGLLDEVSAAPTQKPETTDTDDEESTRDHLIMPGTFGTGESIKEADLALQEAHKLAKRRNSSAVVERAISALRALQNGGWSIWTRSHSASEADLFIRENVASADALARLYGSLALDEQHVQRWTVAYHLIHLIGPKLDASQRVQLLSVSMDHVREMVGAAPPEGFSYIGTTPPVSASDALLELLLWALDHPSWERRDTAAAMVLWLLRSSEVWTEKLTQLAVSMDGGNRADIAAASLDILSRESPTTLWERIMPFLDLEKVMQACMHAGRFATLLRIAERAGESGVVSAIDAVKVLRTKVIADVGSVAPQTNRLPPSYLPPSLHDAWGGLVNLGALSEAAQQKFESVLQESCAPYSISDVQQLEALMAIGFREQGAIISVRWATKVRYALNVALFPFVSIDMLSKVEAVLRTYNPNSLVEPSDGRQLIAGLIRSILAGQESSYIPANKDLVYLDAQCVLEVNGKVAKIDLTSYLIPPGQRDVQVESNKTFKSTELQHPGPSDRMAVCGRVKAEWAHFGILTPAIATPQFLGLIRAPRSMTFGYHWRDGSTVSTPGVSRRHEVSMLVIRREALILPTMWRIQWVLRINGQPRAVIDKYE